MGVGFIRVLHDLFSISVLHLVISNVSVIVYVISYTYPFINYAYSNNYGVKALINFFKLSTNFVFFNST
jgi:hypothetical protein